MTFKQSVEELNDSFRALLNDTMKMKGLNFWDYFFRTKQKRSDITGYKDKK